MEVSAEFLMAKFQATIIVGIRNIMGNMEEKEIINLKPEISAAP